MPDKDPANWAAATWVLALSMAVGGGVINWYRVEKVSLNRVSTPEGASFVCSSFSRDLDRDALQAGGSSSPREQGTGNG